MKKTIHLLSVLTIFLIASAGCSSQDRDTSQPRSELQTASRDSAKTAASARSDSVLVTFIELGSVKCIPCKMMQPIMDEIEKKYANQVKVVFHDVWTEEGRPHAEKWRIRAIPTQIFLDKNGIEYFRHTGFFPKEDLLKVLKQKGVK